mmetsp:Transcript_91035/g.293944  ORF Transcript_91035/g.293944 Transcript_91035/m.293944 type:complete len:221 (+) Transcript_91035:768-1430(+)
MMPAPGQWRDGLGAGRHENLHVLLVGGPGQWRDGLGAGRHENLHVLLVGGLVPRGRRVPRARRSRVQRYIDLDRPCSTSHLHRLLGAHGVWRARIGGLAGRAHRSLNRAGGARSSRHQDAALLRLRGCLSLTEGAEVAVPALAAALRSTKSVADAPGHEAMLLAVQVAEAVRPVEVTHGAEWLSTIQAILSSPGSLPTLAHQPSRGTWGKRWGNRLPLLQ